MGFATPFPEPRSTALERFVVRARPQIVDLLRRVHERGVLLNTFFGEAERLSVSKLVEVDPARGRLVLDEGADTGPQQRRRRSPLTVVGFLDGDKLQFNCARAAFAVRGGRPAIAVPMPREVLRLERRSTARRRLPDGLAVCRLPVAGAAGYRSLAVVDLSAQGLALSGEGDGLGLRDGAKIGGCQLDLPGVGGVEVGLRLCHVGDAGAGGSGRLGFSFEPISPAAKAKVEHFLAKVSHSAKSTG